MDNIMPMSTTVRHTQLIDPFIIDLGQLIKEQKVLCFNKENALVHYGIKNKGDYLELLDGNSSISDDLLIYLDYVQPDFFMFKENKFIIDKKGVRIAGYPDLIVEVWSRHNSFYDKELKFRLYSTGITTEHWYIEQKSNTIKCYLGAEKLKTQSLKKVLKTQNGLEFDLRYLAL